MSTQFGLTCLKTTNAKNRENIPRQDAIRAGYVILVKSYCIVFSNIKSSPAQSDVVPARTRLRGHGRKQDISIGYVPAGFQIPRLLGQARVWSRSPRRIRKCRERTYRYSALTNPVIRVMDMGTASQGTPNHPAGLGSTSR